MMNKINDPTLSIVLKLVSKASLDAEVKIFDDADISACVISEEMYAHFRRNLNCAPDCSAWHDLLSTAKRVAIVCLAVSTLLFTAAMCIEPIRAAIIEVFVTQKEDYVAFNFEKDESSGYPSTLEYIYLPGNLADGWTMTEVFTSPVGTAYTLNGPNNETIRYEQSIRPDSGGLYIDNTDVLMEEIVLDNGLQGYLTTYPNGDIALVWYGDYIFSLLAENSSLETVLEIANCIQ